MTHPAALEPERLLRACATSRHRSSGPGGQHRNKVETGVTLAHTPTGVEASANERRSVRENMPVALWRLRLALAVQVRLAVASGDARSDLWRSRVRDGKIVCSPSHEDFPALLAEALDVIEACALDTSRAALRLCCTPTQLVRFVREHPPAFERLNAGREARGLRRLR